jgi:C4-dicarboxylate-specific signal transduction histidine kinase
LRPFASQSHLANPARHEYFRALKTFRVQTILALVLMLASSLPILGFGLLEAYRWRTSSIDIAKERVLTKSEALANELHRTFEVRISVFEALAEQMRLHSRKEAIRSQHLLPLMAFYAQKFGLVSVGLSDTKGQVLEYYNPNAAIRAKFLKLNVRDRGFIDLILKNKVSVVTSLKRALVSPKNLFFLAAPVWNIDKSNIIATVGSGVGPAEIQRIGDKIMKTSPLLTYRVVDQNGVVVAGSGMQNYSGPLNPSDVPLYAAARTDEPELRQGNDEQGTPRFAAAQTLKFREANWTVIVSETQDALLQGERDALRHMLWIMSVALLVSLLLAALISYLMSQPIVRLIQGMQMIQQGQYDQWRENSKNDPSGFQEISSARQALAAMVKKLHDYTVNLETAVTERTRELDIQRAISVESARLASLGEMAGGIAHEINNPLSIIHLLAEQQLVRLRHGAMDSDRIQHAFESIADTVQRIVKIITGLKTFSRDGQNDPLELAGIRSLIENTLTFCEQKFKHHGIHLSGTDNTLADILIECRPIQLSQVLLNLLNNAFDAVENAQEKWIRIEVKDGSPWIEIRVTDSGAGVPEPYREKIFQPFFTLKEVGKGTGLGLSISRRIIESLGGRIELDTSQPHTSFVIYLKKPQDRSP